MFFVVMSFAMLRNAALADFNAGQFAQNFGSQSFIVSGADPAQQVIYVGAGNFSSSVGAYNPIVAGMIDPSRPGDDIGRFNSMGGSGYVLGGGTIYGDDTFFSSFALNPVSAQNYEYFGRLNYDIGATRTSNGSAINLGIVYLYTKFATNSLYGYDYTNHSNAGTLNEAFQLLLSGSITNAQWQNNQFLSHLVTELGGPTVWLMQYDLNETNYPGLGNNYAVYVMNLSQIDYDRLPGSYPLIHHLPTGDMLFLVGRDSGSTSDVPEPATLFAWSVIGLGLFGASRYRKRRITDANS